MDAAPKPAKPITKRVRRPKQVTESAAEQQQAAERQGVTRDDPLPAAVAEAEVLLRLGQRDVHDGRIEHDHELCHAYYDQHPPAHGM
ncbi:hypothetical protein GCM10010191_66300 [Actinomadura vinacea]|uniref:Uncharacterized protein n=2 Tax=Actinomadura vinacea TaxID=115336 RepID=A0ABN3JUN4_9ACTN